MPCGVGIKIISTKHYTNTSANNWLPYCDDDCYLAEDFCQRLHEISQRQQRISGWGPVIEGRGHWRRRAHRALQLGSQRDLRRLTARRCTLPTKELFWLGCMALRSDALADLDQARQWPLEGAINSGYALGEDQRLCAVLHRRGHRLSFHASLEAAHIAAAAGRADAQQRGLAKGRLILEVFASPHQQSSDART